MPICSPTHRAGSLASRLLPVHVALGALTLVGGASAQVPDSLLSPGALKNMSLEQLMAIEVSSVSRRAEHLSETASAIQVITRDDIRRSGATRLPEALRLATNLEVDQLDASQWAISARGFNSPLANKLLVLIDGRSVYSPLFAGVFWDEQDVLLEDVEQIEVISGPGATAWGANAVNGVINITTRSAKETQGLLVVGGGGTELHGLGAVRYGAAIGSRAHVRVNGKVWDRDGTTLPSGQDLPNGLTLGQGGFRLDWDVSAKDVVTLQGDLYEDHWDQTLPTAVIARGSNVIGRWSRRLAESSDLKVQVYADRVHRKVPGADDDVLHTYDLDVQHHIVPGPRHDVVWGVGYRLVKDDFGPGNVAFDPRRKSLETFSGFAQDEVAVEDRLHLTLGAKVEHDPYTGFEVQPSARLAWKATAQQTVWSAVSRAVRTPSRFDRDQVALPGPDFHSEELVAYELGYRAQATQRLSLSVAAFYHDYDDLRTVEPATSPGGAHLALGNGQEGESYGLELVARYRPTDWWQLQLGHTELRVEIRPKPGSADQSFGAAEAADSKHHFSLRSSFDLPSRLELDAGYRYVSRLTNPMLDTPGYSELDLRLGWTPVPRLEVSITGQNLLHDRHLEFALPSSGQSIERAVFAKAVWGF